MSDFIVGFFVGSIVAAIIYMFKLKAIYEKHTTQLIEIRNERNKYHALYEINADRAKSFVKHMQNVEPDPAIKESAERGRATLDRMNQISPERRAHIERIASEVFAEMKREGRLNFIQEHKNDL